MPVPTDQQILDAARSRLADILAGRVAEFSQGNYRARMLEISQLEKVITQYERRVAAAGGSPFSPVIPVQDGPQPTGWDHW